MTVETTFIEKLLQGVQGDGFLEKSPVKHLAAGGKKDRNFCCPLQKAR
jgi:hypothetical protein